LARPPFPNGVWACEFVFDACASGQKLKCFTAIDGCMRESLAIEGVWVFTRASCDTGLREHRGRTGTTAIIRRDNRPEFVATRLLEWMLAHGIQCAHIDRGKPSQNGTDESFNGRFRDECLNAEWFRSRAEARPLIEAWRRHYNDVRPHSALGNMTPPEFRLHHEFNQKLDRRGRFLNLGLV